MFKSGIHRILKVEGLSNQKTSTHFVSTAKHGPVTLLPDYLASVFAKSRALFFWRVLSVNESCVSYVLLNKEKNATHSGKTVKTAKSSLNFISSSDMTSLEYDNDILC